MKITFLIKRNILNVLKKVSQIDIVIYLINTDEKFYNTYQIYQGIIKASDSRDKDKFLNIIHH